MRTSDELIGYMRGALTGALLTLKVATTPSPSHRLQFCGKGPPYYVKGYQVHMADCLRQMGEQAPLTPLEGDLGAILEVVVQRPKASKFSSPRSDVDNHAKAPMDAATKAGIWKDDSQVQWLSVLKRWTMPGEAPGVTLTVGALA